MRISSPTIGNLVFAAWVGACTPSQVAKNGGIPDQVAAGNPTRGEQRFGEIGCNGCHVINGVGGMIGPDLSQIASRPLRQASRWPSVAAYIEESIRNPQAYVVEGFPADMPSAEQLQLTDEDVRDVVAYLLTLR